MLAIRFNVIRQALRREMLVALMRMWDSAPESVGLTWIADRLDDQRIVDALAAECVAYWERLDPSGWDGVPEADRETIIAAFRQSEGEFGRQEAEKLRKYAAEAVVLIRYYGADSGPSSAVLKKLKKLRNKRLAHRDLVANATLRPNATDDEIGRLYQDMSRLMGLLYASVHSSDYRPEDTANIHARNATLFWASVRGERTEGHPDFRASRAPGGRERAVN